MFTRRSLVPIAIFALAKVVLVTGIGHWLAARGTIPHSYQSILAALLNVGAGYYGARSGALGWWCGAMVSTINGVVGAAVQIFISRAPFQSAPSDLAVLALVFAALVFPFVFGSVEGFVGGLIARSMTATTPDAVA